jgi:hypothetical protein|tara:strand:- start:203 stop:385 length:183 start_codon:yes stop_codon:yes gene_type:complete
MKVLGMKITLTNLIVIVLVIFGVIQVLNMFGVDVLMLQSEKHNKVKSFEKKNNNGFIDLK